MKDSSASAKPSSSICTQIVSNEQLKLNLKIASAVMNEISSSTSGMPDPGHLENIAANMIREAEAKNAEINGENTNIESDGNLHVAPESTSVNTGCNLNANMNPNQHGKLKVTL